MLEKSQTFAEKAQALMTARLEAGELDAAIDAALEPELKKLQGQERALPKTGTGTATALPESSASTPVQGPLAS
jgi:hypothetical protein